MAVIDACRQGEQWALAVALLREMAPPSVEAYTAALAACGKAGQWEVAVGLLREVTDGDAVAAVAPVDGGGAGRDARGAAADDDDREEEEEDCDDDLDAGGEAGGGGGRRRQAEAAVAAVAESAPVPLKPDLFLYNAAIEACGNAGQWQRALELLSEISEIGLSPSVVSLWFVFFQREFVFFLCVY